MRGVTIQLPTEAASKFMALQLDRDGALDASRSANVRLQRLPADADRQMAGRLSAERDRHNQRHATLAGLLQRINQYLVEMRPGVTLELAPPVVVEKRRNEDTLAALDRSRAEIAAIKQKINAVKRSPLPKEEQHAACVDYVSDLLRHARPKVAVVGDKLRVTWRDTVIASKDDLLATLAWFSPSTLLNVLERELPVPTNGDALTVDQRKQQVAELEKMLDQFERCEESLIERAAQDGLDVPRRQDAHPLAVLNLVIKTEAQATVAA